MFALDHRVVVTICHNFHGTNELNLVTILAGGNRSMRLTMKSVNATLFAAALLIGLSVANTAFARGSHHGGSHHGAHFGVFIGAPAFAWGYGPYYYPPYYPYYPPAVVAAPSPPVYVERADEQPAPAESASWYYCPDSQAYYPYVKSCPSPWQRVAPQPPRS